MKIAYLTFEDFSVETGVAKKICGQASEWQRLGHDIALVAPRMKGERISDAAELTICEFDYPLGVGKYLDRQGMGIREVIKFNPDVVYNRYFILPPWHLSLATRFSLVFEVNSEESEFALYHSGFKRFLHSTWRKRFINAASGAVFISHELSRKAEYKLFTNSIVIANGVKPPNHQQSGYQRKSGPLRFFFMGNGQFPWHGVDKIRQLAVAMPDAHFDIVGDPTVQACPPNVAVHGPLERKSYHNFLVQADVAIGPLSLHTKSLTEASPLKVREYLAHGIPSILAYKDSDIPVTTPLTLHLPNTPDNIGRAISEIRSFAESAKGQRIPWSDIAALGADHKERTRLSFFEDCISGPVRIAA